MNWRSLLDLREPGENEVSSRRLAFTLALAAIACGAIRLLLPAAVALVALVALVGLLLVLTIWWSKQQRHGPARSKDSTSW